VATAAGSVDSNYGWKGESKCVSIVPQTYDLRADPQERYDIFMNSFTESTWMGPVMQQQLKKVMKTLLIILRASCNSTSIPARSASRHSRSSSGCGRNSRRMASTSRFRAATSRRVHQNRRIVRAAREGCPRRFPIVTTWAGLAVGSDCCPPRRQCGSGTALLRPAVLAGRVLQRGHAGQRRGMVDTAEGAIHVSEVNGDLNGRPWRPKTYPQGISQAEWISTSTPLFGEPNEP